MRDNSVSLSLSNTYTIRIIACDQWNDNVKWDKDNNAINQH